MVQAVYEPSLSVDELVGGFQIVAYDYGLISGDGMVGDVVIEILPSWDNVSMGVWETILLVRIS